jgi:hypothetical protein
MYATVAAIEKKAEALSKEMVVLGKIAYDELVALLPDKLEDWDEEGIKKKNKNASPALVNYIKRTTMLKLLLMTDEQILATTITNKDYVGRDIRELRALYFRIPNFETKEWGALTRLQMEQLKNKKAFYLLFAKNAKDMSGVDIEQRIINNAKLREEQLMGTNKFKQEQPVPYRIHPVYTDRNYTFPPIIRPPTTPKKEEASETSKKTVITPGSAGVVIETPKVVRLTKAQLDEKYNHTNNGN